MRMAAITALDTRASAAKKTDLPAPKSRTRTRFGRSAILLAAAATALILKLFVAMDTFGTNDVITFYQIGHSLTEHGLKATYSSSAAVNHPPLTAIFIEAIYRLDQTAGLREYGISFPFLIRLPGIIADLVVVLLLLWLAEPLRIPTWSLVVFALSPVSIMISGYHGNTDSVLVMFMVLAAAMALKERALLAGVFLALSCHIKIIGLLMLPVFVCYWIPRRRLSRFLLGFSVCLLAFWAEPLLHYPNLFAHRVLLYGSFWGLWGITYWLKQSGVSVFAPVTYVNLLPLQVFVATVLKGIIVGATALVAWIRRRLDSRQLFISIAWVWIVFFIFSPGVCIQYLVWPAPFLLVLSPRLFSAFTAAGSLFAFFFYNTISGGLPWYRGISAGDLNERWLPWSLWPWAILIVGAWIYRKSVFKRSMVSPAQSPPNY
jgi:Glycosyltransferase family 87